MKMIIEVSCDGLNFEPIFEFSEIAFNEVFTNGKSISDFVVSTLNSCTVLKEDPKTDSYRIMLYSNGKQFYFFDECPIKNYLDAGKNLLDVEIAPELKKYNTLTTKEKLVLEFNYQIACKQKIKSELNIEESTFKLHLKSIYKKLDVHTGKQFNQWCERFLAAVKRTC